MKGRKLGQCEVTVDDMAVIADMTKKNENRSDIAKAVNRSERTIYLWQKKLGLI